MIQFTNVYARYPGAKETLRGISLHIEPKKMYFLSGLSGAGKSTLLRTILRLLKPTHGTAIVDNTDLNKLPERKLPEFRQRIGVVFQDPQLLPDRNVFDNIIIPLLATEQPKKNINTRVDTVLGQVGLSHCKNRLPNTLSVGEQQRAGIARALINNPRLILADEPTGNLDPELSREIFNLFENFNGNGATILIATHDVGLLNEYPHPLLRLQQGRIVQSS